MTRPAVIIWEALKNAFKCKKATIDYPYEEGVKPEKGLRGAHRFEIEKCIGCSRCARVCPADAIEMVHSDITRTNKRPVINLSECIFCALCADNCPKDCLHMTDYIELSAFNPEEMIIYQKEPPKEEISEEEEKKEKST
ncbi:MAG: NADH-quinone oxidoreductase subunit I [Asgard group archaeon]|nr:NADH-quinone oxidoreductase subunit I [Asgard group archaeon]